MADESKEEKLVSINNLDETVYAGREDELLISQKSNQGVLKSFKITVGNFIDTTLTEYKSVNTWIKETIDKIYKKIETAEWVKKNADIKPGIATKVTYDEKGLVTSGASLISSDIPGLNASKIVNGQFDESRIKSGLKIDINGSAVKATYDSADNAITAHYATKAELSTLDKNTIKKDNVSADGLVTNDQLSGFYTKEEADGKFASKDAINNKFDDYYTKSEADNQFKSFVNETDQKFSQYYTKEEADGKFASNDAINNKFDDYYTKSEAATTFALKNDIGAINSKFTTMFPEITAFKVVDDLPSTQDSQTMYFVKQQS